MSRHIRPLDDADLVLLSAFLRRHSAGHATSRLADPDVLRWKYVAPGPPWEGPRAFVVEQDGAIVACAGFTPAVLTPPGGDTIMTLTMIDWVADPAAPGTGLAVFSHVMRLADTAFHVGGAEITRSVVPRLGFRPAGDVNIYACWFRPWREFLRREKSLRSVQRLGHGILHPVPRRRAGHRAWRATRVDRFDASIEPLLAVRATDRIACRRTVAALNHMLACPVVRMEPYLLAERDTVRGYCIIAYTGWEARLVDVGIDAESPDDWAEVYGAIADIARADPNVCRFRVMAAVPARRVALEGAGFWVNVRDSISVFDPRQRVPALPLDLQFMESDASYA